jgi:hypothetical protein
MVIEKGHTRPATDDDVDKLRSQWDGQFLLDEPARELRVKTGKKAMRLRLGPGGLHRGLEKVLLLGMSKPGRAFGEVRFQQVFGRSGGITKPQTLSRYIHTLRKQFRDAARESKYIDTLRVDGSVSQSGYGYAFNPRWSYLVIRTSGVRRG